MQRPKQKQCASNRSQTMSKLPLTMMERVGLVYVVHHSLAILNHIKAVEYSSNYVAANVVNITGAQMTERFQKHRSFDFLPSVVAEKFKQSIVTSAPKAGPTLASQQDVATGIDKRTDGECCVSQVPSSSPMHAGLGSMSHAGFYEKSPAHIARTVTDVESTSRSSSSQT